MEETGVAAENSRTVASIDKLYHIMFIEYNPPWTAYITNEIQNKNTNLSEHF
jgi:hypothetical protein